MYKCPFVTKCRKKKNEPLNFRLLHCNKDYEKCPAYQSKLEENKK